MTTSLTITRSAVWGSVGAAGGAGLQLASLIILASLLGPSLFGAAMVAIAIVYTLDTLVQNFFEKALVQREELDGRHADTAFWASFVAGGGLVALCAVWAEDVGRFLGYAELARLLPGMSLVLLVGGYNCVAIALLRRRMQFKPIAISTLVGRALGSALAVALALGGGGVWSFVAQQVGLFCGTAATLWTIAGWRPSLRVSLTHFRELSSFAVPNGLSRSVEVANDHLFVLLAARLFEPISLGYYSLAARVAASLGQIVETLSRQLCLSVFSRQQRQQEALRESVTAAAGLTGLLAFPIFLGLAACSALVVSVVFGPTWAPAAPLVQLFALGCILRIVSSPMRAAVDAVGRPAWHLVRHSVELTASVLGLLVLAKLGIVATGIVFLATSLLTTPIDLVVACRCMQVRPAVLLAQLTRPLLASIVSTAVVAWTQQTIVASWDPWIALLSLVAVGAVIYGLLVSWWPPIAREVRLPLRELLRSALARRLTRPLSWEGQR